mgnify:CR=1 FL=1
MSKNLTSKIESMMPRFSKGQKLIASYIIENYDKAAFMTALKLGETVGVSESTVVRFAYEIGFDGYPKLQKAIQEMIRNKLTSLQRIEVTESRIGNSDILDSVLSHDIDKIKRTLDEVSRKDFYAAVDSIVSARKIYILAARSSAALANFLGFYFNLIFDNVLVVKATSETEIYEQLFRISKEDIIIGISFPRYSRIAVKAIEFASDRGASVISMTDCLDSPMVKPADHVILARSDMASIVDSLVAPLSMINALIVATALKKKRDVINTFRELENLWEQYEVYEKADGEEF